MSGLSENYTCGSHFHFQVVSLWNVSGKKMQLAAAKYLQLESQVMIEARSTFIRSTG